MTSVDLPAVVTADDGVRPRAERPKQRTWGYLWLRIADVLRKETTGGELLLIGAGIALAHRGALGALLCH